ncbi:DUF4142 domain-containing protein [Mesorhizobium sp.]|uniref:DUF4142 domain-containing protein n=1 Tax=Mesorhizobium sp. TaxID=1871066 RepID=UPI003426A7D6
MVDDHSAANQKLKSLAEADEIPLPQGLDDEHKQLRAKLEKLEGALGRSLHRGHLLCRAARARPAQHHGARPGRMAEGA